MAKGDLDAELDRLYGAPLEEFVGARNALVKRLEAAGRKEEAGRVKALRKPGAAAWIVNALALSRPKVVAALVAAGDRLRRRPSAGAEALRERRDALNEARRAAEGVVAGAGRTVAPEAMRRVAATLEAIATYGSGPGRPEPGRLTEDVPAPGFDEVASLGLLGGAPARTSAPARAARAAEVPNPPVPPPRRETARERALALKRRREAEKALAARTKEAQAARAAHRAAERAVEAIRRKKATLAEALSEAKEEEKRLEAALEKARTASETADASEDVARGETR